MSSKKKQKTENCSILNFVQVLSKPGETSSKKNNLASSHSNDYALQPLSSKDAVHSVEMEQGATPDVLVHPNDIGQIVDGKVSNTDKERLLSAVWMPEETYNFPSTQFGTRKLKFQHSWLKTFRWLAYSKQQDGAFCKNCVLFAPTGAGKQGLPLGRLVRTKYCNWKHALDDFKKHEKTTYHANCVIDSANFLSIQAGTSQDVVTKIDKGAKEKALENRRYLTPVVKTVMFCGRQGLALRGHRDSGQIDVNSEQDYVENEGNFRALLRMRVESGDEDLKTHLLNAGKNATYVSWRIQNEILSSCNDLMLKKLVDKINSAKCFSVIADETTDISCIEQLSICARYVDQESLEVREDFLQFVPIFDVTGKGISSMILSKLREFGVAIEYMRGQGFDGASAMSGMFNGVQTHIRQQVPNALYVHCSSHTLNLALSHASDQSIIRNCLGTVNKIYDFLNTPKRQAILSKHSTNKTSKLKKMCPTRWVQRHDSVNAVSDKYEEIVNTLDEISTWPDKDTSSGAHILKCAIQNFQFVVTLFVIKKVFSYTLPLTKYLQSEHIDLSSALEFAKHTQSTIENLRLNAEPEFAIIFKKVEEICTQLDIPVALPRMTPKQTNRENFPNDGPESYYRRALFVPFLDHFCQEIQERFTNHQDIFSAFEILINVSDSGESMTSEEACEKLFLTYHDDLEASSADELEGEMRIWTERLKHIEMKRMESSKSSKVPKKKIGALEALKICTKATFPSVHKLFQILATLPVTTCTAERSFSSLRYLKTYLRNTTAETRLNGLALLFVHKDIAVSPKEVLDELAKKKRRLDLTL